MLVVNLIDSLKLEALFADPAIQDLIRRPGLHVQAMHHS